MYVLAAEAVAQDCDELWLPLSVLDLMSSTNTSTVTVAEYCAETLVLTALHLELSLVVSGKAIGHHYWNQTFCQAFMARFLVLIRYH